MKPAKPITSIVTETVRGVGRVDRDKGIIYGAKLLGLESGNGYTYAVESLKDSAKLYVGRPVNLDHGQKPGTSRPIESRFGKIIAAEARADGIWGDIQYNRKHPLAEMIAEAAAEMPDTFGLSHEARVRWKTPAKLVAESILQVKSVDVVADPATTSGLYEHLETTKVTTFNAVRESLAAGSKVRQLYEWLCEEGMGMGDMPMAEAPAASSDPDQALKDGIVAAMQAALEAFKAGDMDSVAMVAKIKDLAKTFDKATGSAEAAAVPPAEEAAAEESKKAKAAANSPTVADLQEQLKAAKRENLLHRVCQAESYQPTPVILKHLARCETETEMKELITESKKAADADTGISRQKPKSGLQGTVSESVKAPASQEEFNRLCFGKPTVN